MKICYIPIILLILLTSCKATIQGESIYSAENRKEIDLVYESVINSKIKNKDSTFVILYKSIGNTNSSLNYPNFIPNDSIKSVGWNENIFPNAKFADTELIQDLKLSDFDKYLKFIDELGQNGWFELYIPIYTVDKKFALIEMNFYLGKNLNEHLKYLLEKKNGYYEIIETIVLYHN